MTYAEYLVAEAKTQAATYFPDKPLTVRRALHWLQFARAPESAFDLLLDDVESDADLDAVIE